VKIIAEGLVSLGHEVTVIGQSLTLRTRTQWLNGVKRVAMGSTPGYAPVVADNTGRRRWIQKRLFSWAKRDVPRTYRELILKEKPDVIHTNVIHPVDQVLSALSPLNIPIVHTLRIYHLMCNQRMYFEGSDCRAQCAACAKRFHKGIPISNGISAVVGISKFVLQRHLDAGYFSEVHNRYVVSNSYDVDPARAAQIAEPKAPTGRFLFMGRVHPSKGIGLFAELAKNSPSPDFIFRVCGRGHPSYEAEVRSILAGTRHEWLGFANHEQAFGAVDWLVVPSLWGEPFGRVVIEAFAHGIPVIASDGAAFPELIEHGKNGFLFSPEDPNSLLEIARDIAAGRYNHQEMRRNALASAKTYSSATIARRYEQIYEAVLGERSR